MAELEHEQLIRLEDGDGNAVLIGLPVDAGRAAAAMTALGQAGWERVAQVKDDDCVMRGTVAP